MAGYSNLRVSLARPKKFSWLKFFTLTFVFAAVIGAGVYGYAYISLRPMATAESNVQKVISQKTSLTNLHDLTINYRDGATYAVLGETTDGKQKVAIIQGKDGPVQTFDYGDGLSPKQLGDLLKSKYNPKRVYSADLSVYQKTLVWEVSYEDQKGTLNYLTMDYKKGTVYRAINGI